MSASLTMEARSLFGALLVFFWGEFLQKFNCVNIHGVGVFGGSGGQGERLEGLSGSSALLSNLFCTIPLILEVGGFRVPVINFIWDYIKGHDLLHEWGGKSSSEEADEDVVVHNASMGGVAVEG